MNKIIHPQLTREEIVREYKKHAEYIRKEGIDTIVSDSDPHAYAAFTDTLAYPLDVQGWITPESEPVLDALATYAVRVDNDKNDRDAWENILKLIDVL